MRVILQQNYSESNVLSKDIRDVMSVTGQVRQEFSITNPVLVFQLPIDLFAKVNYMTIDEFNRKYHIDSITSISKDLTEVVGHVDVLATYNVDIRRQKAIIRRNRNLYNTYLNDGQFKIYNNAIIKCVEFPYKFERSDNQYVLVTIGSGSVLPSSS